MQEKFSGDDSLPLFRRICGLLRLTFAQIITPSVFPVALLIDGDNHAGMSSELLAHILAEAGKLGGVVILHHHHNYQRPVQQARLSSQMHV